MELCYVTRKGRQSGEDHFTRHTGWVLLEWTLTRARTYEARYETRGTFPQLRTLPGHGTTAESGVGGVAAEKQT